jgi:hypothetical protein
MMQHQSPEYDSVSAESITLVSRFKWRVVLAGLLLTIVGGIVMIISLLQGLGDPIYAPQLVVDLTSDEELEVVSPPNILRVASLSDEQLPITIEVIGNTSSESATVWGIWIQSSSALYLLQIRSDGYFSAIPSGWQEFIHIQPNENRLYLHIEPDENATFRINDEIAWIGTLQPDLMGWGVVRPINSPIGWRYIRLYTG